MKRVATPNEERLRSFSSLPALAIRPTKEEEDEDEDEDEDEGADAAESNDNVPARPVPLPPGTTEGDFAFLFKNRVNSSSNAIDRVKIANKMDRMRLSLLLSTSPTSAVHSFNSSLDDTESESPRIGSAKGKKMGSRADDLEHLFGLIERCEQGTWTEIYCPPEIASRFTNMVSANSNMDFLDGITESSQLLVMVHTMLSFSSEQLLTKVLSKFFAEAAVIEESTMRKNCFHSLLCVLPEQNRAVLKPLMKLLCMYRKNMTQFRAVCKLFGDVLGGDIVASRLAEDWKEVSEYNMVLPEVVTRRQGDGPMWVVSASREGLVEKLLDPYYELNEHDFLEMFCRTLPYFMKDYELLETLQEKYVAMLVGEKGDWQSMMRKRVLVCVHYFLKNHRGKYSAEFHEALGSFKMSLHEDGNDSAMVHVLYILRYNTEESVSAWAPPHRDGATVDAVKVSALSFCVPLFLTVSQAHQIHSE